MADPTRIPFNNSFAFIIGINEYQHTTKLKTAVGDAEAVAERLGQHQFQVHTPLLDAAATKQGIEDLFTIEIPRIINENKAADEELASARLILYFAGHGIAFDSESDPNGYLVPVDGNLDDQESLVAMRTLKDAMDTWQCRHGLLIMDCCFAGAFRWSIGFRAGRRRAPKVIYDERFLRYASDPAWQVLASSSADEEAIDVLNKLLGSRPEEGHSPFAQALLEGLDGAADFGVVEGEKDGVITATELYVYLRDRVQRMTANHPVKQTPTIFELGRHGKGEFMFVNPDPTVPFNLPPFPERNPYLGLSSFTENDATLFYGREDQIEALWEKVQAQSLVVVTAGSGTGKTSLVQAGLMPKIRTIGGSQHDEGNEGTATEDTQDVNQNWTVVSIPRAGTAPLTELTKVHPEWESNLEDTKTILIIDQYEETLSNGIGTTPWTNFESKMAELVGAEQARLEAGEDARFKLILVVRSDYELLLHGMEHPLQEWWTAGRYFVPPFSEENLLEVIEQPARQSVLFFEPEDFPITLLNEIDQSPRALPILSFTLNNLYEKFVRSGREDRTLTEDDYREMGGLIGALSSRADQLYEELGAEDNGEALQKTMKKVVLRLLKIENGQFVRRKIPILPVEGLLQPATMLESADEETTATTAKFVNELDFAEDEQDDWLKKVLTALVDNQLVSINRGSDPKILQPYLEPIHDALINFWPSCLRWVQEFGPNNIVLQETLWKAVMGNLNRGEKTEEERAADITISASHLWDRHPRLEEVHALMETENHWFNQLEVDFITQSWKKKNKIVEQLRKERDEAQSSALSARAMLANQENPTRAFNLAMQAYEAARIPDTCQAIKDIGSAANARFYRKFTSGMEQLSAIAIAPDGKEYILGSDAISDAAIITYDEISEFHSNRLRGHSLKVLDLAFSPDGEFILTGSHDRIAILWDRNGVQQQVFVGHEGPVFSVSFLPTALPDENGHIPEHLMRFLTASADGTAKLWDMDGKILQNFPVGGIVWTAAFTPDGQQVLTAGEDKKARLWDLEAKVIQVFGEEEEDGHTERILSVAMSLDGVYVLTGGADNRAILWEKNGKKFFEIDEHTEQVNEVCFSPDGRHLLTVGQDGKAVLGLLEDYQPQVFVDEGQPFKDAAFSPDGKEILIACRNGQIIHQDLQGMMVHSYADHGFGISPVVFAHDSPFLFIGSKNNTGLLVNLEDETERTMAGHGSLILTAVFSLDDRFLLTGSMDGEARLWDLEADPAETPRVIVSEGDTLWAVALSKDNTTIYTGGSKREIRKWKLGETEPEVLGEHPDDIMGLALSSDERFLLSGGRNGSVLYWNLESEDKSPVPLEGHSMETMTTAISPDGQWLLSGGGSETDGKAILYDQKGDKVTDLIFHKGAVTSASFSSDGHFILTTSKDNTAAIWNLEGNLLQTMNGHKGNIWSGSFSGDARWVATKSMDETVKIWHHYMLAWADGWMDQADLNIEFNFGAKQEDIT